jgi:hypothetical protein
MKLKPESNFFVSPYKILSNPKEKEIVTRYVSGEVVANRPKSRTEGLKASSGKKKRFVRMGKVVPEVVRDESKIIKREIEIAVRKAKRGKEDDYEPCYGEILKQCGETKIFATENKVEEFSESDEEGVDLESMTP